MILLADLTKQRRETLAALEVQPELGMEMAGDFRARVVALGFVAEDDSADLDLVRDPAAAMVGESRVVVADDPGPVEPRREAPSAVRGRRPAGGRSRTVVEAVAKAIEASRAAALDLGGERRQRRVRIIRRQELAEPSEPARLFEVQVGDEQRLARRPEQRAGGRRLERFACERKGNHEPV